MVDYLLSLLSPLREKGKMTLRFDVKTFVILFEFSGDCLAETGHALDVSSLYGFE